MMLNEPPVFLDEIQYVPSLFRYVKLPCDKRNDKGLFFLSGSQPFELMDMVSDSLAGRSAIIEMTTLSLREIMNDECKIPFWPTLEYIQERNTTVKKLDNMGEY